MSKKHRNKKITIKGLFKVNKTHYSIITEENTYSVEKDLFDFSDKFAQDGDEVKVLFIWARHPKAKLLSVTKRHNKYVVGYVKKINSSYFFVPLKTKFLIKLSGKVNEESLVKAQIIQLKNTEVAKVIQTYSNSSENDEAIIIAKYNLPTEFNSEVGCELQSINEPSKEDFVDRSDFRNLSTLTIDGADAKDFDDAIDIEFLNDGYRLYVHIADVSYYAKDNSAIEKSALDRGFSVYFPQSNIPMLPRKLSDDICSLVPGKDRLAFTVILDFDKKGNRKAFKFTKSIIRNKNRLTYDFVEDCLNGKVDCDENLKSYLHKMKILAKILSARRFLKGSLELDIKEPVFIIENNEVVNIVQRPKIFAYEIIEEFMLAANKAVADYLKNKKKLFLHRIHEKPQTTKLMNLVSQLKEMDYIFPKKTNAKKIQKFIQSIDATKRGIVSKLILRSLERAEYSLEDIGHFALGFENYTHFTSPIRRFPDLIIHKILSRTLLNMKEYPYKKLESIVKQVQKRELVTEAAEYFAKDIEQARFVGKYIGKTFNGTIVSMIGSGVFVELKEIFAEGFLPYSALKDDFYTFFEQKQMIIGRKTRKVYRLGDFIKVKPTKVDIYEGKIDLELEN
ncbi:3'-to-5' exoribonuclease RNase R [Desulfurella amilsii]|uniref:exoribonuclease II n=1 Tax=Desulfurella amilsii TaxID=1562698 RepID=A0A1X4XYU4_9BACT|nr:VacB/RNase II family 3'-5' exoribonuclease [Desulfurella amilsii]OSS42706.1 3'-to-5' exoribonuclease RNase R [Desulfurella amilsii]